MKGKSLLHKQNELLPNSVKKVPNASGDYLA